MAEIKLLKMKLVKKETLTVAYVNDRKGKKAQIHTIEDSEPVHQDLKNAFVGLHIHFALLSDYLQTKHVKDITDYDSLLIKDFYVSGITLGGAEDEEYVILTGQKTTASGKVVIINTPHTRVEEDDKTRYKYMDEMLERIKLIKAEVLEYMGGKHAPRDQTSLFDAYGKPTVTHAKIADPVDGSSGAKSIGDVAKSIADEVNTGIIGEVKETPKEKRDRLKRVAQTASNPSGQVNA